MKKAWSLLALILVPALVLGMVNALATPKQTNTGLKHPKDFTEKELHVLYAKYNITENDIKFARGELPHFLDDVLDGPYVVMGRISPSGGVVDRLNENDTINFGEDGV